MIWKIEVSMKCFRLFEEKLNGKFLILHRIRKLTARKVRKFLYYCFFAVFQLLNAQNHRLVLFHENFTAQFSVFSVTLAQWSIGFVPRIGTLYVQKVQKIRYEKIFFYIRTSFGTLTDMFSSIQVSIQKSLFVWFQYNKKSKDFGIGFAT